MKPYRLSEFCETLEPSERLRLAELWGLGTEDREPVPADLVRAISEPRRLASVLEGLTRGEREILERLRLRADHCMPLRRILDESRSGGTNGHSEAVVEEGLAALERLGLLWRVFDRAVDRFEEPAYALPSELAALLADDEDPSEPTQATPPALTLSGFLDSRRSRGDGQTDDERHREAAHARQAYKLFLMPNAVLARVRRLPPEVGELFEFAATRFGGLVPLSLYERTRGEAGPFEREGLADVFEEALCGTVGHLDLRAFGVAVDEPALLLFQEVTLVYLQERAKAGVAAPADVRTAGVDLATNVMRFLRYVDDHGVRYTLQGEIFKATRRRILSQLVVPSSTESQPMAPNSAGDEADEGSEDVETSFRFLYRFCLARRLVDRTGERTLRLAEAGRAFEERALPDKLKELLAFAVEDPGCGGDPFHQVKLRRIFLRLLRRLEAGTWYDAMYLPFLARNHYLAGLETQGAAEYYASCRERGRHLALEDLQQLSWHLFHWVRKRLHLLGIVDLGSSNGRATALRLSPLGASLLAGQPAQASSGARSSLVVNSDYEILLFPEADAFELVHTLDRFSERLSADRLYRFRLSKKSVRAALADGMAVGEILEVLSDRCRVPIPQSVLFNLRAWADEAGVVALAPGRRLLVRKPEILDRLLAYERVRELCGERRGRSEIALRPQVRVRDFRALLHDLGFHLENGQAEASDDGG